MRGLWMLLGYALAVLVATTVVCIAFGLPTILPDNGRFGSFYNYLQEFPVMFMAGSMMTAMYGLPGWLVSVAIAEMRVRQGKLWFAVAGLVTSVFAILIAGRFQHLFSEAWLNVAIFVGGFAGGLAYWALAGKTSGNWKRSAGVEP